MLPNKKLAIQHCKRNVPELVADACQLEGIDFSVPEIQTLLSGITIGGKYLYEQQVAVNQIQAWKEILHDVNKGDIQINKSYSNKIHAIAAQEDAMEWGNFRTGMVRISGTDYTPPRPDALDKAYNLMLDNFETIQDEYDRAIYLFLHHAKNQFYFDNNKRQGRFMMNAHLLNVGLPTINVPKKREEEFNRGMLNFYNSKSHDSSEMKAFLMSCIHPMIAKEFDLKI